MPTVSRGAAVQSDTHNVVCASLSRTDTGTETAGAESSATTAACQLLEDLGDCGACYSAETTCTYGEFSVTEGSCQQCQAMAALYLALCNSGNTDSLEAIEDGMVCTDGDS